MAKVIVTKEGKTLTLLTPSEKGTKYAKELHEKVRMTNAGNVKVNEKNDKPLKLTDTQSAWRSGYLSAQKDSAKCFNAKKKNKKNKKK